MDKILTVTAPPPVTIGRSAACDLCLPDARVSRRHVVVDFVDDVFVLRDLRSTGGTRARGERVQRLVAREPFEFEIGEWTVAMGLETSSHDAAASRSRRLRLIGDAYDDYRRARGAMIDMLLQALNAAPETERPALWRAIADRYPSIARDSEVEQLSIFSPLHEARGGGG